MRIAFVVGGLPFGGIENLLLDIATGLQRQEGFEVCVFNLSGTGQKIDDYRAQGVPVVNVAGNLGAIKTHRLDTVWRLRRSLAAYAPDLIHTQQFSADFFGRIAALGLRRPVVTHIHNTKVERKPHRRLANRLLSHATDLYVSVSGAVKDLVERDHNRALRPSIVLYNAMDFTRFPDAAHDLGELFHSPGRYCVAVGRLVPQKKYDLLLDAFALLSRRVEDARLAIIGEGPQRENLRARIEANGLHGKAFLAGYRNDVGSFLRGSHAMAMPSLYEGLPIAHIEAMYAGLPAVVSRFVPSIEFASSCSLVAELEAEDLARALERLYEDSALHERMSGEARRIALQLDMPSYVRRLARIYRAVIEGDEGFFRGWNADFGGQG